MPLHKQLKKALAALGFNDATEVQQQAIPEALAGKDLMVSAKTGSGKTAAFMLPMLDILLRDQAADTSTRVLILLPTRELALQTQKTFQHLARFTQIRAGLIIGGEAYKFQVATIRKNPEVLIATPGRLVEHIEKGSTDFSDLEILILDEADRMLDMGFADDMNTIAGACRKQRQSLLFSATLKHRGIDKILSILTDPLSIEVDSHRQPHSQITQQIVLADDLKHKEKLVLALIKEQQAKKVMVFCKTRQQCEQLGNTLKFQQVSVGFIHGEIAQSDRKQVMSRFRDNKLQVLVATDVAARGLDIEAVDLVINFTVAHSGDDHVHRVGRTGRAGEKGLAVTLISSLEWNLMSSIERYLKIRFEHRKIKGLVARYTGPKKLKKSGKAAGSKKKKIPSNAKSSKTATKAKHQKRKGAAKKGSSGAKKSSTQRDGFAVLKKRESKKV
ncbi:MAG: DEAD/DEAH box helicase [Pseudomonadales bacterium]|nr:DEAD/DEAH box helicase [Pseudomonadales bacterium]